VEEIKNSVLGWDDWFLPRQKLCYEDLYQNRWCKRVEFSLVNGTRLLNSGIWL